MGFYYSPLHSLFSPKHIDLENEVQKKMLRSLKSSTTLKILF